MKLINDKSNFPYKYWLWNKLIRIKNERKQFVYKLEHNNLDIESDTLYLRKLDFVNQANNRLEIGSNYISRKKVKYNDNTKLEIQMFEFLSVAIIPKRFARFSSWNGQYRDFKDSVKIKFLVPCIDGSLLNCVSEEFGLEDIEPRFEGSLYLNILNTKKQEYRIFDLNVSNPKNCSGIYNLLNIIFPNYNFKREYFNPYVMWNLFGYSKISILHYTINVNDNHYEIGE